MNDIVRLIENESFFKALAAVKEIQTSFVDWSCYDDNDEHHDSSMPFQQFKAGQYQAILNDIDSARLTRGPVREHFKKLSVLRLNTLKEDGTSVHELQRTENR
jgi:hypothetical protein